jgi:hypothetical protein
MELTDIVTAVVLGAMLGVSMVGLYIWSLYRRIKNEIDRVVKEVVREAEQHIVGLTVERENGRIYCYLEDGTFVAQGIDLTEIKTAFALRFPDKTAYLDKGDPEVIAELRKQIDELRKNETSPSV